MDQSYKLTHNELVDKLLKPGVDILLQMTPAKANLNHLAMGVSGEAGELLDVIKAHVIYDKPLDITHCKEELGDLEFFLNATYKALGLTREECLEANIDKLTVRYHQLTYTDEQAQTRADKKEPVDGRPDGHTGPAHGRWSTVQRP